MEIFYFFIIFRISAGFMLCSHQVKAKGKRDVTQMESSRLHRTVHTKPKQFCFRLNGLQSHSSKSESDIAFMFAFAWCE